MNLKQHLESKTNGGLILLLLVVVGLAVIGKLTHDAVEAVKWLGASFMAVRASANATENLRSTDDSNGSNGKADQGQRPGLCGEALPKDPAGV